MFQLFSWAEVLTSTEARIRIKETFINSRIEMPIYEYVCLDCGERFEQVRLMKEADDPIACRNCESDQTSRMLSLFFASSGGKAVAGVSGGCAGCSSSSCGSCKP
jgi:putative FmdB family regulatory protein